MESIARSSGRNDFVAMSLDSMASICFDEKDYKSALSHCNEALAFVKPEDRMHFSILQMMQTCYGNLEVDLLYFVFLSYLFCVTFWRFR